MGPCMGTALANAPQPSPAGHRVHQGRLCVPCMAMGLSLGGQTLCPHSHTQVPKEVPCPTCWPARQPPSSGSENKGTNTYSRGSLQTWMWIPRKGQEGWVRVLECSYWYIIREGAQT